MSNVRWLPAWREPLVAGDLVRVFAEIDEMKRVLAERDRIRREAVRKCLQPIDRTPKWWWTTEPRDSDGQ